MPDPAPAHPLPLTGAHPRISFFDEQARRRRHALGWTFAATSISWLMGWVLGFSILLAASFYVMLFSSFLPRSLEKAVQRITPDSDAMVLPLAIGGLFFAGALWGVVRFVFGRDTSAAFLERLGARSPNPIDLEEKQLVNVVAEMAIAATVPAPRVRLFDGDAINAAVLGTDAHHATLLVSRRMLDTLDRDETQGVIGHLTASAVNGDLQLTAAMLHVFYVLGLSVTILDLPFSSRARATFGQLVQRVLGWGKSGPATSPEATAARLTESLQPEGLNAMNTFMQRLVEPQGDSEVKKVIGALLLMPLLPLIMIRIGAAILYGLLSLFVLGPLVALVLRARRRLADATAVQLTRNPDGLACALVHLVQEAHTVENAGWAEMLFIVGPEAAGARQMDRLQQRLSSIREAGDGWKKRSQAALAATQAAAATGEPRSEAKRHNFVLGFHPSLDSRIAQLQRMGATKVQWQSRRDYSGWIFAAILVVVFGSVALLAIASSRK